MCVLCFDGMTVVKEVSGHGWGSGNVSAGQLGWCEGAPCDTSDTCKGGLPESGTKQSKAKLTCHDQA